MEVWGPFMALNWTPIGVSEATVGWIGFIASLVSSFATLASSYWADRLHGWFKRTLVVLICVATAFFVWQSLIVMGILPYSLVQLYISTIGGMAVNYACTPLFFELGSEVAYPAGEGPMAGTMTFFLDCSWNCVPFSVLFQEHWLYLDELDHDDLPCGHSPLHSLDQGEL